MVVALEFFEGFLLVGTNHIGDVLLCVDVADPRLRSLAAQMVTDRLHQMRLAQTDAAVDKQGVVRNARVLGDLQCCGPRELVGFAGDKIVEIEVAVESSAIWRHDRGAMAGRRGWPRSGICNQSRGENKFHIDLAATQFRGKTHLVQAIGNHLCSERPQARVRYIHAEQYVTDVVRAYQQKSFEEFKRYYHSLDLLLIDDIQFFSNKDRTQEEFFYAFNALVEAHKQIVITCDTYPKEIAGMQERLISRFGWGLTVAIEPPELEMRVAIVLKKAEADALELAEGIAFFIAKHIRSNVRELEGALKKVLAFARFTGRELSLELAREALRDIIHVANRQINVEGIQKTVAEYFKIKISDMHSKRRNRNIARPRQVAMALAKDLTQMSLPEIGEAFGNRDHTTVLHACRTIASLRKKDIGLNRDYHLLEQVLKG